MINKLRPLSPSLGIYKIRLNSFLSISHRISGALSFLGFICMIWILACDRLNIKLQSNFFGECFSAVVAMWLLTTFFYISTEIRYIVWHFGKCYDLNNARKLDFGSLILFISMTIFFFSFYI